MTFRMKESEKKIDFALIKKEYYHFLQSVKVISGEFQHALVVADIDRKIRNVVKKTHIERRKISFLKDVTIMKQL